jgi:hypothetical protein
MVLPDPLAGTGFWNMGAWALPSTMLSACSAAVFAAVFVSFQLGGAKGGAFVFPSLWTAIIGGAGALLAWVVVVICRRRPGRIWPRVWALFLACANTSITLVGLIARQSAWPAALAVAGFTAAIALTPRLVKLRPDSAMVQRIAPLSLLILLIAVPSSCAVRRALTRDVEGNVERGAVHVRPMPDSRGRD